MSLAKIAPGGSMKSVTAARKKAAAAPARKVLTSRGAAKEAARAGRPTLAELERRKAKVMDVATRLFVLNGFAATSLVDIAKEAGVATRTVYQHFGDKEAIFFEVLAARETGAVFPHPSLTAETDLFDATMAVARYICDVSLRPRSVDLMRLTIAESRRFPNFTKKLCGKAFASFRTEVAQMFDELTARGLAPAHDTAGTAALLVDLILGSTPLLVYAGLGAARPSDEELAVKVDLFLRGRFGVAKAEARGKKA
jgi:AcrR family transcriptional regulator